MRPKMFAKLEAARQGHGVGRRASEAWRVLGPLALPAAE